MAIWTPINVGTVANDGTGDSLRAAMQKINALFDGSNNFKADKIGIGMTATNILDITQSQSAASVIKILNNNSGVAAAAELDLANGTSTGKAIQYGASFTTSGIARQNGTRIDASGAGGLTLSTSANQPVYIAVNATQVAQFSASAFAVTIPEQITVAGGTGDVLTLRGGGASTKMQMTMGRNSTDWTLATVGSNDDYIAGSLAGDLAFFSNAHEFIISTDNGASPAFLVSGTAIFAPNSPTTGSAANVFMDNAASNKLMRSTSSARYKRNFTALDSERAWEIIGALRPGTYLSLAPDDDPERRFYGMLAEDVAKIAPELVTFTKLDHIESMVPEGYVDFAAYLAANEVDGMIPDNNQYERLTILLIAEAQAIHRRLAAAGIA